VLKPGELRGSVPFPPDRGIMLIYPVKPNLKVSSSRTPPNRGIMESKKEHHGKKA
jgi:hypothetical protein